MAGALRELFALLEIEVDEKELKEADQHLEGFVEKIKKVGETLAEAFAIHEVQEFIQHEVEAGAQIFDLSKRLGIATDDLQNFAFAARLSGVDMESATHSLSLFNRTIGEALTGDAKAAGAFQKLGVQLKANGQTRDFNDILNDVADSLQKLPDQFHRAKYAKELFGRQGQALLPILADGAAGLAKLREEYQELGGPTSKELIARFKETDDETIKLKFGFGNLKTAIAEALLPQFLAVIRWAKEIVKHWIDLSRKSYALHTMLHLLGAVSGVKLVATLIQLGKTLGLVKGGLLETLMALMRFAAPIALLYELWAVWDDFYTLLQGGNSVIGDILEQMYGFEGKEKFVQELRDAWADLKAELVDILPSAKDVSDALVKGIPDAIRLVMELANGLRAVWHLLTGIAEAAADVALMFRKPQGVGLGEAGKAQLQDPAMVAKLKAAGVDVDALQNGGKEKRDQDLANSTVTDLFSKLSKDWQFGRDVGKTFRFGSDDMKTERLPPQFAPPPTAGAPEGYAPIVRRPGEAAGNSHVVHFKQDVRNEIHTSHDNPEAIGNEVSARTATAAQAALRDAAAVEHRP